MYVLTDRRRLFLYLQRHTYSSVFKENIDFSLGLCECHMQFPARCALSFRRFVCRTVSSVIINTFAYAIFFHTLRIIVNIILFSFCRFLWEMREFTLRAFVSDGAVSHYKYARKRARGCVWKGYFCITNIKQNINGSIMSIPTLGGGLVERACAFVYLCS